MRKLSLFITIFVAVIISGCSVSNWNVGKTQTGSTQQEQPAEPTPVEPTTPTPPPVEAPKPQSKIHIDKIIEAWGSPSAERRDERGNKVYIYQNCKPTGMYIDKCDDSGCKTVPETKCCERALVTDKDGYVLNLKEAVNSCM